MGSKSERSFAVFFVFLAIFVLSTCENQWQQDVKNHKIVTFNTNGGLPVPANQELFGNDMVFRPFDPVLPGYSFAGWYVDNFTFLIPWNFFVSPNGHMTLHAKWEGHSPRNTVSSAAITVTAPAAGITPDPEAGGEGNFEISAVTWTPGDNPFKKSTAYTATVTLTAVEKFTFTAGFSATINGNRAEAERESDTIVILSYTFPETESREVTGITVIEQPVKFTYTHGEPLVLSDLEVRILYDDNTSEDAEFDTAPSSRWVTMGIRTDPAHGEALSFTNHDNESIRVWLGAYQSFTNKLTVNRAVIRNAVITVTAPVAGSMPAITADAASGSNFTVTGVSWRTGGVLFTGSEFATNTVYVVTIRIYADNDYTFTNGLNGTLTINGGHNLTGVDNYNTYADLSYEFAATGSKIPAGITIITQPAKLTYFHSEALDLTGLVVTVTYSNAPSDDITFSAAFGSAWITSGITASPAHGTQLNLGSHNGNPVTLTLGSLPAAYTDPLTVNPIPIADAVITNITAPVTGTAPVFTADAAGNFTVKDVSWSINGSPFTGPHFAAGMQYTVTVRISAANYYTFTGGLTGTVTVNGYSPVTITNNDGAIADLSYTFPATDAVTVTTGGSTTGYANLQAALDSITVDGDYIVTILTNQNLSSIYNFSGTARTITLRANSPVTIQPTPVSMLFIIGSGVKLILDNNITLQGSNLNTVPLVQIGGTLEMKTGARICGNTASTSFLGGGGGVLVQGGTFTMLGGEISGNAASGTTSGGGVYVNGGTFTMTGGIISGNSAANNGGGVYIADGTFTVGGDAKVYNNIKTNNSVPSNVYLSGSKYITLGTGASAPVSGASGMNIHVNTGTTGGVIVQSGASSGQEAYFTADDAGKEVYFDSSANSLKIINIASGAGTQQNPFLVRDEFELRRVGTETTPGGWTIAAHYKVANNITLTSAWTVPIGTSSNPFTGSFDGDGKTISGLTINNTNASKENYGLFGYNIGTIKNVVLSNVNVGSASSNTGGIAGANTGSGIISNCYVTGSVTGSISSTGGIAGVNSGTISNCYFIGSVTGGSSGYTGGIAGGNGGGTISNCYVMGSVKGSSIYTGGIAGCSWNGGTTTISNCYATADVEGNNYVGGIVGYNGDVGGATLRDCIALNSSIIGNNNVGRVAGDNNINTGTITNNYAWSGMTVTSNGSPKAITSGLTTIDGASLTAVAIKDSQQWINANFTLGNSPWTWNGMAAMPSLYGVGTAQPWPTGLTDTPAGPGTGAPGDPFKIDDTNAASILQQIGTSTYPLDAYYKLTSDITLQTPPAGQGNWTRIGSDTNITTRFSGNFDGNGYTISNLTINTTANDQGLFGALGAGGVIQNVGLIDVNISGGGYTGGIVGNNYGTVENCFVTGTVNGVGSVGGITGYNSGSVQNCYVVCNVSGSNSVGGIVGSNGGSGSVNDCIVLSQSITGTNSVGRVVGITSQNTLTNNYAWDSMTVTVGGTAKTINAGSTTIDGANISAANVKSDANWPAPFRAAPWQWQNGKMPRLYNETTWRSWPDYFPVTDVNDISAYLQPQPGTLAAPANLPVEINLDSDWQQLLTAIANAGKYINLDLSACTMNGTTFNPAAAISTGKDKIINIVLPDSAQSIQTGTSSAPTFSYFTGLKSFSGAGLKSTGNYAFYGCTALISMPAGITSIGNYAFYGCTALTSLSAEITSIGDYAFRGCTSLTLTSLPAGIMTINQGAFENCTNLALTSLPTGITSISARTFNGCTNLALPSLPTGIMSIGNMAFQNCKSLSWTSLPAGINSIGSSAFWGCTSLALTTLPAGITTISSSVFYNCTGLTNFTIPNSVTSIDVGAFSGCSNLTNVTISGSLTELGSQAFMDCSKLASITIPASVLKIDMEAFIGCTKLSTVIFAAGSNITDSTNYIDPSFWIASPSAFMGVTDSGSLRSKYFSEGKAGMYIATTDGSGNVTSTSTWSKQP